MYLNLFFRISKLLLYTVIRTLSRIEFILSLSQTRLKLIVLSLKLQYLPSVLRETGFGLIGLEVLELLLVLSSVSKREVWRLLLCVYPSRESGSSRGPLP